MQLIIIFISTVCFSWATLEAIKLYRLMKIHKKMRDELFDDE